MTSPKPLPPDDVPLPDADRRTGDRRQPPEHPLEAIHEASPPAPELSEEEKKQRAGNAVPVYKIAEGTNPHGHTHQAQVAHTRPTEG